MIPLINKPNVDPPSPHYPNGSIRDNPGDGSGTPVNKLVYNDIHQFFERLMVEAGVAPNGLPEDAYYGFQLIEALKKLFVRNAGSISGLNVKMKTIPIGVWNMLTTLNVTLATGIAFSKMRGILNVSILRDDLSSLDQGPNGVSSTSSGNTEMFYTIDSSGNIFLSIRNSGSYNGASYSTLSNRGYVTFLYEE